MKQATFNFNIEKVDNIPTERITPAKGSIYPFSKHTDDLAFVAFLERIADRWEATELEIDDSEE